MNYRKIWLAGGLAALALTLVALPSSSRGTDKRQEETPSAHLKARLAEGGAALDAERAVELADNLEGDEETIRILTSGEDGEGWLGVEIRDVTPEAMKDFKLTAERGVILNKIMPDSPAAKAGLKENDVVTEINGQRVEGAVQFRRMIHETPAGRPAQLSVWRGGHGQTISVTIGKAEEAHKAWMKGLPRVSPGGHEFVMPYMPDVHAFEWNGELMPGSRPRLGIDAEDLSGDFGKYFGAPEGEGILVREVSAGSAAEKAGLKAGDVIIKYDGERIRSVGDLREKLAGLREAKEAKTVKLGVLRNRSEMAVEVTIEPPAEPRAPREPGRRHI